MIQMSLIWAHTHAHTHTHTHTSCFELLTCSQMWQRQKETRDRNRVCLYNLTLPYIKQTYILYPLTVTHYEDQPLLKPQITKQNYMYSLLSCFKPVLSLKQISMRWSGNQIWMLHVILSLKNHFLKASEYRTYYTIIYKTIVLWCFFCHRFSYEHVFIISYFVSHIRPYRFGTTWGWEN